MPSGIYKIINTTNNKFYVGSAVNLQRRRARHFSELRSKKHSNKHLQAAWNKYGEAAFIFVVVEHVADIATILAVENKWLKDHVGKPYCYNLGVDATAPTLGWGGEKSPTWGYKHTTEAKIRIGSASKARVQSEEEKAKRRASMKGHIPTAATRAKISQALSGEGNPWHGKKRPEQGVKVSKPVITIHPSGGIQRYPSILALRESLGVKPPTVNRAVKSGKPIARGPLKGWVIKYVDNPLNKE